MNEQQINALALIKELHAMGASRIVVDMDYVEARFDRSVREVEDVSGSLGEELVSLRAENEALRIYKEQTEVG